MRSKSLSLAAAVIILATACRIGPTLPPPPCPVEELLLDESLLPEGFYRGFPSKDGAPMRFGIDKTGVGFGSKAKEGGAIQDVYLDRSTKQTQKQFIDFVGSEFSPREGWTEWYTPDSFDYQSSVADQYRFACYKHIDSGTETCQAIGQYGPYLIRFLAGPVPSFLSYQELERALQAIDERAARCLGK